MAVKKNKSKKSDKRKKALAEYIEKAAEYAQFKADAKVAADGMQLLAPELRKLAKAAGLDKTKEKPQVNDRFMVETRFPTTEKYDTDRLRGLLKERGLKTVLAKVFTKNPVSYSFDKAQFEALEEAGEIPADFIEEMEGGDDPIYKVEDATPAIYVHEIPVEKPKPAKSAGRKAKAKK